MQLTVQHLCEKRFGDGARGPGTMPMVFTVPCQWYNGIHCTMPMVQWYSLYHANGIQCTMPMVQWYSNVGTGATHETAP